MVFQEKKDELLTLDFGVNLTNHWQSNVT